LRHGAAVRQPAGFGSEWDTLYILSRSLYFYIILLYSILFIADLNYICGHILQLHMWTHFTITYVATFYNYICGHILQLHMWPHFTITYVATFYYYICGHILLLHMWPHFTITYVATFYQRLNFTKRQNAVLHFIGSVIHNFSWQKL
jgi:hypothetical protein